MELNKVYLGDCLEYLKKMADKSIDVIITDPPYGLGIDFQKEQKCKNPKHNRKKHKKENWENSIPSKEVFLQMQRVGKKIIVFGANYFNEYLEQGYKGWIIWDKGQRGLTMSDCEIIYTNFNCPTRIITINRCELRNDMTTHPTQKPLKLMIEIVKNYTNENDVILDCFAGSGSTLEACQILNRRYIGIELNETYFKNIKDRLNGILPNGQISLFTNQDEL